MSVTTSIPVQENMGGFLGLQSYTEANSNSFFGRDSEIDATSSLIQLNTLTIVFGRSGTGKTSLLNAGVFPKLRKNYCLPFRIRLEFNKQSPDLVTQVKNVLKKEIDKYGFNVQTYPGEETLWEYFHKEFLWVSITPILVFDQFEEIFTLAKSNPRWANEMPAFWEELSDLIENNIPKKLEHQFLNHREQITYNYKAQRTKIVFAFREEYLPEFESITSKIPSLKYSRFRLLPMNGNQAYEVITKTWKEKINPSEAKQIVSYFTNEQNLTDYNLITVEPSLLSQVCTYIDKERIQNGGGKVSAELLNKYPKEAILRSIYEEAVNEADNSLKKEEGDKRNLIKEFVEEKLITTEGFRTRYHLGSSDELIIPGINVLAAKYFVREDDNVVELTHDVIAPIIKVDREERRNMIAMAEERRRAKEKQKKYIRYAFAIAGLIFAVFLVLTLITNQRRLKEERLRDEALLDKNNAFKEMSKLMTIVDQLRADSARLAKSNKPVIKNCDTCGSVDTNYNKPRFDLLIHDSINSADRIAYLEKIIVILKDSIRDNSSEIEVLKRRIIILRDSINNLKSIIFIKDKEYKDLQDRYNDLKLKYDSLLIENADLRKQLADCIMNK